MYHWAEEAGELARSWFRNTGELEFKTGKEAVTEADRRIETLLRRRIGEKFPDDLIVGEEFGGHGETSADSGRRTWQIDPIDGTLNFALGLPEFCLSLGVMQDQDVLAGGVFQPISGDAFTATAGAGARLNGEPVAVSERSRLSDAVVSTHLKRDNAMVRNPAVLHAITISPYKIRKMGAVALELAYVAAGFYDALIAGFDSSICLWDIAAGMLLVKEAGGRTSDEQGGEFRFGGANLLVSNGLVHDEMVALVRR